MNTYHAIDRLSDRLSDSDRQAVIKRMAHLEDYILSSGSAACVLGHSSGQYSRGKSEGRVIVGIWRNRWVTVMLRRENQPIDCRALGVDRIVE